MRRYCPAQYLEQYDQFVRDLRAGTAEMDYVAELIAKLLGSAASGAPIDIHADPAMKRKLAKMAEESHLHTGCPGHDDPHARLRDMDADGITAEIIFAGGQNAEAVPFIGFGADIGSQKVSPELRKVGEQIWNRWLADFVSVAPERLLGVMQVPIWDVDAAVREMEECRKAGLRAVNFPAPRSDFPPYNDRIYEPFWSACEDLEIPLVTHSGGGDIPLGFYGEGGSAIHGMESIWLGRRGLWELIFGGVFERHPKLRFTVTEQRMSWVAHTLRDMDYIHRSRQPSLPHRPSEYWAMNCYIAGSYMAHWEAELRYEVGVSNLQWGTDYPHQEGTWPYTSLALRNAFHDVPEPEVRKILGENALRAYYLDEAELRVIADRIGPTPEEIARPLEPGEAPEYGAAFREAGTVDAASF
jgi:predicted TIM-barrel fold metal-dependent hydrolase